MPPEANCELTRLVASFCNERTKGSHKESFYTAQRPCPGGDYTVYDGLSG